MLIRKNFYLDPCAHAIALSQAMEHGLIKAIILSNIDRFQAINKETLHQYFEYLPKDVFEENLSELINEGLLIESKKGGF